MYFRKLSRFLLLIPLLVSAVTPARAETYHQSIDPKTALIVRCPSTVLLPSPKQNGCSPSFDTMIMFLNYLPDHQPSLASVIWIGKNYDSSKVGNGNVELDGLALTKMAKYPLTIKGGWDGLGTGTLNVKTPTTFDGDSFLITSWTGNVSIRNILVKNVSAGCGTALCVRTAGSIKLDRVRVNNGINLGGASLDNANGGLDTSPAPVIVTNSQFNENDHDGLEIYSNGMVTLANLYAEGNTGDGADVNNTYGAGDVLLKGTETFLGNDRGLHLESNGNVTAQYLLAYRSGSGAGVEIINQNALSEKAVTITGSGEFTDNYFGLWVTSAGNVNLNRVNANSNTGPGIFIAAAGLATVTCSGTYDNGTGIYVQSLSGGAIPKLILQGFLTYGNGTDEHISADQVVRSACP